MSILVHTRLDMKYLHPGSLMVDPYTEERDGHLYLVSDNPTPHAQRTAILCDAIVSIAEVSA